MSDDEEPEVEFSTDTEAEHFEVETGYVAFPEGLRKFCEEYNATAVHIDHEGSIWLLDRETGKWVDAERQPEATVAAIRPN